MYVLLVCESYESLCEQSVSLDKTDVCAIVCAFVFLAVWLGFRVYVRKEVEREKEKRG